MSFWNDLAERLHVIKTAKKNMYEPKEKKDPNKIVLEPIKPGTLFKKTPEQMEEDLKANRGTGTHKNTKDKRAKNPNKMNDGW
jgi:hypothetical protein